MPTWACIYNFSENCIIFIWFCQKIRNTQLCHSDNTTIKSINSNKIKFNIKHSSYYLRILTLWYRYMFLKWLCHLYILSIANLYCESMNCYRPPEWLQRHHERDWGGFVPNPRGGATEEGGDSNGGNNSPHRRPAVQVISLSGHRESRRRITGTYLCKLIIQILFTCLYTCRCIIELTFKSTNHKVNQREIGTCINIQNAFWY